MSIRVQNLLLGLLCVVLGGAPASAINLYGTSYNSTSGTTSLFLIDQTNGSSVLLGDTGFWIDAIDFHPSTGVLWGQGVDANGKAGLYTLDRTTGAATLQLNIQAPYNFMLYRDIEFTRDGRLFASRGGGFLTQVNLVNGSNTPVSHGFQGGGGLVQQPLAANQLLVAQGDRGGSSSPTPSGLFTVGTNGLFLNGGFTGAHHGDRAGRLTYFAFTCSRVCGGSIGRYDLRGNAPLYGNFQIGAPSFGTGFGWVSGIAVPEPGSALLAGFGLLALVAVGRRSARR